MEKPHLCPQNIKTEANLLTPQVSPLSDALARKLLATASCCAVLCNPDIYVKNLIKASSTHRDHTNDQQLPIVLNQYHRAVDLK